MPTVNKPDRLPNALTTGQGAINALCILLGLTVGLLCQYDIHPIGHLIVPRPLSGEEHQCCTTGSTPTDEMEIFDPALRKYLLTQQGTGAPNGHPLKQTQIIEAHLKGITTLQGLQNCTNLTYLDLANTSYVSWQNVTPVFKNGMPIPPNEFPPEELTGLSLMNGVRDLSPLAQVRSLTTIDLTGNLVEDLTPLLGLQNLMSVNLRFNPLSEKALYVQIPELRRRGVKVLYAKRHEIDLGIDPTRPNGIPVAVCLLDGRDRLTSYWADTPENLWRRLADSSFTP